MNNKAAQKAVPYVIATTDTQNWLTTKLPQFCPLQPPLFFQRCKIISKLQESHSYALQKKMGPKSMRHQSAFPYGSSQVSKTHPSQESCQTMIDGNSMNIHYIDYTYIRQSPFRIQVSVFKTLYTLYFLLGGWEVRHEQFKVEPRLLACLDQYHPLNGQKCNTKVLFILSCSKIGEKKCVQSFVITKQ